MNRNTEDKKNQTGTASLKQIHSCSSLVLGLQEHPDSDETKKSIRDWVPYAYGIAVRNTENIPS